MKGLSIKVECYRQDFSNVCIESQIGIPLVLLVISLYKLVSKNTAVFSPKHDGEFHWHACNFPAASYWQHSTQLWNVYTHTYLGNGCHYHVLTMWLSVFSNWHVTVHICIMLISNVVIQKGATVTMTGCCSSVPWK